jgi:hypothetical protein
LMIVNFAEVSLRSARFVLNGLQKLHGFQRVFLRPFSCRNGYHVFKRI